MRAGIYTRLSSDPDGTSTATARQEEDARAHAAGRGWSVEAVYRDNDLSAYKRSVRRPDFEIMLEDVAAGRVDVLIVWKSDRLARQPRDLERFLDAAESRKVALVSLTEPFDASNGMGLFMLRQMVAFASYESAVKSDRIRRKTEELAADGKPSGGPRAFGFEPDGIEHRADEAALIREAAARIRAGDGLRVIARDWNARGIRRVRSTSEWTPSVLHRSISSPRVAGLRAHRGKIVGPGIWKPILERREWEEILAALASRNSVIRTGASDDYLLRGLAVCGKCDARLYTRRRGAEPRERLYVCPRDGVGSCGGVAVQAEPAEEVVTERVLGVLADPEFLAGLGAPEDFTTPALAALEDDEALLTSLAEDYAERIMTRAEYLAARRIVEERVAAARGALNRRSTRRTVDAAAVLATWDEASVDRRRSWLAAVVERVRVNPQAPGVRRFDRDRIAVEWIA